MWKTTEFYWGSYKGTWIRDRPHYWAEKQYCEYVLPTQFNAYIYWMWLKSQGNFYIEKSDSKVHLVEYMSETNENFENRIIGRDVYQILKYLKSNINRNRVVLELVNTWQDPLGLFLHCNLFHLSACPCLCQFHPHSVIVDLRYFNVYIWKIRPPTSWLQCYTANSSILS